MKKPRSFIHGKTILIATLLAIISTVLIVYVTGLSSLRAIIDNAMISLTILSILFFVFLTVGLYNGLHIHDDISHKLKVKWGNVDWSSLGDTGAIPDMPDVSGSNIFLAIIIWIIATLLFILFMYVFGSFFYLSIMTLIGMIYWVLLRALRLIFAKSAKCYHDIFKSVIYAGGYTVLYIGWIYGVVYLATLI